MQNELAKLQAQVSVLSRLVAELLVRTQPSVDNWLNATFEQINERHEEHKRRIAAIRQQIAQKANQEAGDT